MEQLDFFIAPVACAPKAPATKRSAAATSTGKLQTPVPKGLTIAEQLNRGIKVDFPKNTNAIRVTIGSKTIVILKADSDTLKSAGVATTVEFGTVKNDAKGHPIRKNFEPLATGNDGDTLGETLALSLQ